MDRARLLQQLLGRHHALFVRQRRQHPRQHFRWFDRQQYARPGLEDLLLLRRVQQHHGVDHEVRRFQRSLRGDIAGQRGVAAVSGHVVAHGHRVIE
ncbi:hypothetical protein D3C75_1089730 [compost metagenome]